MRMKRVRKLRKVNMYVRAELFLNGFIVVLKGVELI